MEQCSRPTKWYVMAFITFVCQFSATIIEDASHGNTECSKLVCFYDGVFCQSGRLRSSFGLKFNEGLSILHDKEIEPCFRSPSIGNYPLFCAKSKFQILIGFHLCNGFQFSNAVNLYGLSMGNSLSCLKKNLVILCNSFKKGSMEILCGKSVGLGIIFLCLKCMRTHLMGSETKDTFTVKRKLNLFPHCQNRSSCNLGFRCRVFLCLQFCGSRNWYLIIGFCYIGKLQFLICKKVSVEDSITVTLTKHHSSSSSKNEFPPDIIGVKDSTLDCQNYCINFILPYTRLSYIITRISLCQVIMARGQPGKRKGAGRGTQKQTIQYEDPSKRGRKTHKEVLENIADLYKAGNSAQIRNTIHGWERESSMMMKTSNNRRPPWISLVTQRVLEEGYHCSINL